MDLRVERAKRKWTQDELSERSGIARGTISNIENGKQKLENVTVKVLVNLSKALNVPLNNFFE
ncbi:XRE family transcriptional regulator [Clostridium botulinum]|uniref:XRE family transcriptional regulator n=1 Tax=Clostridium botulinum TaxID=1491 RepID=A0A6M0SK60_CLOBO|nr:XRE family transcriptional regulator [Clostridium botulinum]